MGTLVRRTRTRAETWWRAAPAAAGPASPEAAQMPPRPRTEPKRGIRISRAVPFSPRVCSTKGAGEKPGKSRNARRSHLDRFSNVLNLLDVLQLAQRSMDDDSRQAARPGGRSAFHSTALGKTGVPVDARRDSCASDHR